MKLLKSRKIKFFFTCNKTIQENHTIPIFLKLESFTALLMFFSIFLLAMLHFTMRKKSIRMKTRLIFTINRQNLRFYPVLRVLIEKMQLEVRFQLFER